MVEDVFRELQKRLDKYSMGFPATDSGIEIDILKKLFSEEDAGFFLHMSPKLETPGEVARRLKTPVADIDARLSDMARRGLLFRLEKSDVVKYGAIPFVHGLFEFQVKRMDRGLADLVEEYFQEAFNMALLKGTPAFLRTVPVGRSVDVVHRVASYDDASEIIRKAENIVVTDCVCRKQKGLIERGCDKPREVCFMFGSMGQYYLDHDMGRKVDADEALRIISEAQDAGLVTQPATSQNPGGMCNCCGDCCGVLNALNKHPRPAEIVFSNYYAAIEQDKCSGCETCLERCQMRAIEMNEAGVAEIDNDRCIGCGLCVVTCPEEALKLILKPDDMRRTPPANVGEQMAFMAQTRGVI